jgi:hypothetical protein
MATLPDVASWADLEVTYLTRGRQIVECDMARRLVLDTLQAERRAIDDWLAALP